MEESQIYSKLQCLATAGFLEFRNRLFIIRKGGHFMQNVLDISKYVVFKYWKTGRPITNLKLQKILYYIQGYSLKRCNEIAYPEAIYRWPYGPVVPEAYFEYNKFRSQGIGEPTDEEVSPIIKKLQKDRAIMSVTNNVIENSFSYTAAQLVEKTHHELPWKNSDDSEIISRSLIAMYFSSNDPLGCEA